MLRRHHATLQKLVAKQQRMTKALVHIREISVTQAKQEGNIPMGDYSAHAFCNESREHYLERTLQHITSMTVNAMQLHLYDNFEEIEEKQSDNDSGYRFDGTTYSMRPNRQNHVTRLSFNEYYFFPDECSGPLTEAMFQTLMTELEKFASQLPENLHLVLASFPLLTAESDVINLVIYVQCGLQPALRTMAKADTIDMDPWYESATAWHVGTDASATFYQTPGGVTAGLCTPFLCQTRDTAFWTAIDICADHHAGQSFKAFAMALAASYQFDTLLPLQATHLVTSNTIAVIPDHLICPTVVHVDPEYHAHYVMKGGSYSGWDEMIYDNENFRSSVVHCYPEHEMGSLSPEFADQVRQHNLEMKEVEMERLMPEGQDERGFETFFWR